MTPTEFRALIERWHLTPALLRSVMALSYGRYKAFLYGLTPIPTDVRQKLAALDAAFTRIRETGQK